MAVLTNYEGSNDDYENIGTSDNYRRAQAFQLALASTVTSVSFWGSKGNGASGTFEVRITSGASPDSTVIYTETFNTSSLSAFGSPAWNELTLATPQNLSASTTYYLEIHPLTGSATDEVRWSRDTTSPTYSSGSNWSKSTGSWVEVTGSDENFRISGSSSTNVTVSATVLTGTLSTPAPSISGGSTVSQGTPPSATFSTPAPAISGDANVTSSVVTATFSIPAPNIITPDSYVDASAVTATFSLPAPSVGGDANVPVGVLTATLSIPASSVQIDFTHSANVQVATFSLPAPTIIEESNISISASVVTATFSLPSPTITSEQNAMVEAGVLTATFSIPEITVTAIRNVSVDVSVLTATFSTNAPTKVGGLWTAQPRNLGTWTPQGRVI